MNTVFTMSHIILRWQRHGLLMALRDFANSRRDINILILIVLHLHGDFYRNMSAYNH